MRTTVTLDADMERMFRDAMHESRRSFKQTLKAALRTGLTDKPKLPAAKQFVVKARPMGLRAGMDPASFNRLSDDLEAEAFVEKQIRLRRS